MPERDSQPDWGTIKHGLAQRVREVRLELYGENGGPMLASELKIPYRNWVRYESGGTMPGPAMLRFLELTGANPHWLLTGIGPKYERPAG